MPSWQSCEKSAPPAEAQLHALWLRSSVRNRLARTEDARALTVLDPGMPNPGGGPDFRRAAILLDGDLKVGDIELHRWSSGWTDHGHDRDLSYAKVILHVVAHRDTVEKCVQALNGRSIPQVQLPEVKPWPACDGRALFAAGRCRGLGTEASWLSILKERGLHRWVRRARRAQRWRRREDYPGIFLRFWFEALGFYENRRILSRTVDVILPAETSHRVRALPPRRRAPALLRTWLMRLGHRPSRRLLAREPRTRRYWNYLLSHPPLLRPPPCGRGASADGSSGPQAPLHWRRGGSRPVNSPLRRLAGAAELLAHRTPEELWRETAKLVSEESETSLPAERTHGLFSRFVVPGPTYWRKRVDFGPARLARASACIGLDRARELVTNAAVPCLLAWCRERGDQEGESRLLRLALGLPPCAPNHRLRWSGQRMWGWRSPRMQAKLSAVHQQGALHLFRQACHKGDEGCEGCPVPSLLRQGQV